MERKNEHSPLLLVKRFKKALSSCHVSQEERVLVACSGGSDSICLLLLCSLTFHPENLLAVYVNHGLRPDEVEKERDLIAKLCQAKKVRFETVQVDVQALAEHKKLSVEDAARKLRYAQLEELRKKHGFHKIAVGHTADDQVEQFFIRLLRGSNCAGLSGMQPVVGKIIRPLLREKKETLLEYLSANNIAYCHDSSNDDLQFLRNRIRHDLLPKLKQDFNPSVERTVLQTSVILHADNDLLDQMAEKGLSACLVSLQPETKAEILAPSLLSCHLAIQRRIIEHLCWQMDSRPSFKTIEAILDLAQKKRGSGELHLGRGLRVIKHEKTIEFSYPYGKKRHREKASQPVKLNVLIPDTGTYLVQKLNKELVIQFGHNSDGLIVDAEKITFPLQLRSIQNGDRFSPYGLVGTKKINRFLTEKKISKFEKHSYPVLVCENKIVCIPGIEIDSAYEVSPATTKYLRIDWRDIP